MIAGLTREEILHEAIVAPRKAHAAYPDIEVIERPGWYQILTPSFRQGGLNEVAFAQLSDHQVEPVIDATIARYDAHGIRFRWTITPDCRPHDLPERLTRRGFLGVRVVAMAAEIAELLAREDLAATPGLVVEQVDHHNLDRYIDVAARGWDTDPAPLRAYHRAILDDPTDHRNHCFLAVRDGHGVGIANYTALARSAFFVGGVVLPDHRSRGVYRALLGARLQHAAARGLGLVTTHAMATTSAPILTRLGFTPLCELPVFYNR